MKDYLYKTTALSLVLTLVCSFVYIASEPTIAISQTASDTVVVTLNVTAGISITSPADVSMSTALGVAQDTAVGTNVWNVKTNNAAGYTLAVRASTAPAMQSGSYSIADYQTGAPTVWTVSSGTAQFGYSAFGTDITTATWGTDSNCTGVGANDVSPTLKYKGLTTSDVTVATRAGTTTTAGIDSTFCYAVEQDTFYIPSGTYQATVTATATAL